MKKAPTILFETIVLRSSGGRRGTRQQESGSRGYETGLDSPHDLGLSS